MNCFNRKNISKIAKCILRSGFSVIPLRLKDGELKPSLPSWKDYQQTRMNPAFVEDFFSNAHGIAIVTGKISDCIVIDVDEPEKFDAFYSIDLLKNQAGLVVKTKSDGCFHAYFKYHEKFERHLDFLKQKGFEIKSNKNLCTFYSTMPEFPYGIEKCEQLKPIPEELTNIIKGLMKSKKSQIQKGLSDDVDYILQKIYELTGYMPQQRADGIWRGKCVSHRDEHPSLDIKLVGGNIQFKCWAGCDEKDIRQALGLHAEHEKSNREAIAKKLINLLQVSYEFWLDQFEEPYISISPHEHLRINSRDFKDFLQELAYKTEDKLLHSQATQSVVEFCRWLARQSKNKYQTFKRVGSDEDLSFIEVNLLRYDGKILRITKSEIEIDSPKLKFAKCKSALEMPLPDFNIDVKEDWKSFFEVFNIHGREQLSLVVAFMLKTFNPIGEYPILAILGSREGVGKTSMAKNIVNLIDPVIAPSKPHPKSLDDLFVLAKNNFLLFFDNLSNISDSLSDALCLLSTGGSLSKRQLFTDSDFVDYFLKDPVILSSIDAILKRRDLRRRSLVIELERLAKKLPERQLDNKFKSLQPKLYGYLCLCVQEALKEKVINLPLLDVADFCEWILRAEPKFFVSGIEFLKILDENRRETAISVLEGNPILQFIQGKLSENTVYEVTSSELFKELRSVYPHELNTVKSAKSLGKEIRRMASDFEAFSISFEFVRTSKERRFVFKRIEGINVTNVIMSQTQENQQPTNDIYNDINKNLLSCKCHNDVCDNSDDKKKRLMSSKRHSKNLENSNFVTNDICDIKNPNFFKNDLADNGDEEEEFTW